jgi:hypothetical protein
MSANGRTWAIVIVVVAVVLIIISLTFLSQQIQQGPAPTPTGPVLTVTADDAGGTTQEATEDSGTAEAVITLEATAES